MSEKEQSIKVNTGMAEMSCHALFVYFPGIERMSRKEKRRFFGNMDVVMAGYAGLNGSVILAEQRYQKLRTRYPAAFLEEAKRQKALLWRIPEAAVAGVSGECGSYSFPEKQIAAMYLLSEGGIFAGLWSMAQEAGIGLEIDLKKIPVKQETVEICNFFDINPYQLFSEGSCLLLSGHGYRLKEQLAKKGIFSEVIGFTTEDNNRVVTNGEDRRFLEKHYDEELRKILKNIKRKENEYERTIVKDY